MMKLERKRPMCWNFVSKRPSQQHVMKLSKPIVESLLKKNPVGARYSELRNLVEHTFSLYKEIVSTVAEDVKKDLKARLILRWMDATTSYLDSISTAIGPKFNLISVFTDLSSKHSSATIYRVVLGIAHSRGHNSGLFSRPL